MFVQEVIPTALESTSAALESKRTEMYIHMNVRKETPIVHTGVISKSSKIMRHDKYV